MPLHRSPSPRVPPSKDVRSIGAVPLYLSDLEIIVSLLRGICTTVVINAGSATADEVADLKVATTSELRSVSITTKQPDLVCKLSLTSPAIHVLDPADPAAVAAADELEKAFRSYESRPYRLLNLSTLQLGMLGAVLPVALIVDTLKPGHQNPPVWNWVLVFGLFAFMLCFGAAVGRPNSVKLIPRDRSEARVLSEDLKGKIVVGLVVGVVVSIFTTVILPLLK